MESDIRLELAQLSVASRNKKVGEIVSNREIFLEKIDTLKLSLKPDKPILSLSNNIDDDNVHLVDGNAISVCVRVRPLLDYEEKANYFPAILANQPQVHVVEPRFSVKGEAKVIKSTYNVDFGFGPQHSNDDIYECVVANPVVEMGLKGGVSTIFAYG
jgi:hypothetical protein